jgi:hypothetical protein
VCSIAWGSTSRSHPAPAPLDDSVIEAIATTAHGWQQTGLASTMGESLRGKSSPVVGVDHEF